MILRILLGLLKPALRMVLVNLVKERLTAVTNELVQSRKVHPSGHLATEGPETVASRAKAANAVFSAVFKDASAKEIPEAELRSTIIDEFRRIRSSDVAAAAISAIEMALGRQPLVSVIGQPLTDIEFAIITLTAERVQYDELVRLLRPPRAVMPSEAAPKRKSSA